MILSKERLESLPEPPILEFRGEYRFLSNFYICNIKWGDKITPSQFWNCSEVPYQLAKTLDKSEREKFINSILSTKESNKPALAKRLGKKLTLRSDWNEVRDKIMYGLLLTKIAYNPYVKKQLISTGTRLLFEGNNWGDTYWGMVYDELSKSWHGENNLGKMWMIVRHNINQRANVTMV